VGIHALATVKDADGVGPNAMVMPGDRRDELAWKA
jgi:hypothetical protein